MLNEERQTRDLFAKWQDKKNLDSEEAEDNDPKSTNYQHESAYGSEDLSDLGG